MILFTTTLAAFAFIIYMDTCVWNTGIVTVVNHGVDEYSNRTPFQRRLIELSENFWPFCRTIPGELALGVDFMRIGFCDLLVWLLTWGFFGSFYILEWSYYKIRQFLKV